MKYRRLPRKVLASLTLGMFCVNAFAQPVETPVPAEPVEIMLDTSIIDQALNRLEGQQAGLVETQEEINRLANEAGTTFELFKQENDNLEALQVLNAEYRKLVSIQLENIDTLNESIAGVEIITREVPLLMEKMLSSIEQFVELDLPFQLDTRRSRLEFARDAIGNPDVSIAEKFRQVLVLYQNETLFGRTHETYPDTINFGGVDRDVNILRVGRIALMFQTTDRQITGMWDNETRSWIELPAGEYRTALQSAIRVSAGLDAPRIIDLPIVAPELVQ